MSEQVALSFLPRLRAHGVTALALPSPRYGQYTVQTLDPSRHYPLGTRTLATPIDVVHYLAALDKEKGAFR